MKLTKKQKFMVNQFESMNSFCSIHYCKIIPNEIELNKLYIVCECEINVSPINQYYFMITSITFPNQL